MPTENRSSTIEQHDHIEGIIDMVSAPFQHEDRYIVIKRSDLALLSPVDSDLAHSYLEGVMSLMAEWNCPARECLVIESDWPEFAPAWASIEARVTARPAPQPHPEPIAWMVGTAIWWTKAEAERDAADTGLPIVGLGPMTGATEVERLRVELGYLREERDDLSARLDRFYSRSHGIKHLSAIEQLNDKLAERDTLLRELMADDVPLRLAAKIETALSASAEPSATAKLIPEGYCLMPRRLTAENGAKALLLGEFKLEVTRECPECLELDEPAEGCEICDGGGEYAQRHTIPWDQIKFIYSEAVKGLALQSNATRKPS